MGAIGDMNTYMQFKAAQAVQDAAQAGGGGRAVAAASAGMGLGLGAGFGAMMPGMISNAMQQAVREGERQRSPGPLPRGGRPLPGGGRLLHRLRSPDAGRRQVLPQLRDRSRPPPDAPAAANRFRRRQVLSELRHPTGGVDLDVPCTQCGASVTVQADQRLLECPYCSTALGGGCHGHPVSRGACCRRSSRGCGSPPAAVSGRA